MASPEFVDPYLIPGTGVLRNTLGLNSAEDLSLAEADLSFVRALQLLDDPPPPTHDLQELQQIHFWLFQDVYDWAGQIRVVDVRKNVVGADPFMPYGFIQNAAAICFTELADEGFLTGLDRTTLSRDWLITTRRSTTSIRSAKATAAPNASCGIG